MCKIQAKVGLLWIAFILLSGEDIGAQRVVSPIPLECEDAVMEPGLYSFTQTRTPTDPKVCVTILRAPMNMKVRVRIRTDNVSCTEPGVIAFIDGMNLQNDYFPGIDDAEVDKSKRMTVVCDTEFPELFDANQNVASILFRFSQAGQKFTIHVRHIPNPQPCNIVATHPNATGFMRLQNFGHRRNCSYLILFPTIFTVLEARVGFEKPRQEQCVKDNDFFEIRSGMNIDPLKSTKTIADSCHLPMNRFGTMKGLTAVSPCWASVVRLVSSGKTNNVVVVKHKPMNPDVADTSCPVE